MAPTTTPTKTILSLLNLSPLETRLKLKLLVHTFRCIHNKASSLLCAQYQVRSPTHSTHRTTRAQTYTSLIIPRVSKSAGAKSPAFFSTLLWNELPSDLRSLSSVHSFRQKLMVYQAWIPCNEASACRVSIIKQTNKQQNKQLSSTVIDTVNVPNHLEGDHKQSGPVLFSSRPLHPMDWPWRSLLNSEFWTSFIGRGIRFRSSR